MAGNLCGAFVVDRVGRKTLLYISSAFLSVAQAGLGTYFYFELVATNSGDSVLDNYRQVGIFLLDNFCLTSNVSDGLLWYFS